ncbi:MAG: hypothetical protein IE933_13980 [Sphingomonadales bacterium]|nr:hypothetical protein [Sphingomonadales bacterium]MBD3772432.1 hypothetical protein [Paracoccaceae bacterium]
MTNAIYPKLCRTKLLLAAAAGSVAFGPLAAETLPVSGLYPANSDDALAVHSIALDNFDGRIGTRLSFALADALQDAQVEGRPWFTILPFADSGNPPDAVMRGYADMEVITSKLSDKVNKVCDEKDRDGKCTKEREEKIPCRRMQVTFSPDIRLISTAGGTVYSRRDRLTRSRDYCYDDRTRPAPEDLLEPAIAEFAGTVRSDLVPHYYDGGYRVLETTSGMGKDDKAAFKQAIRLTKSDIGTACRGFMALEPTNPQSAAVIFNIGLCYESAGQLDLAETYYKRALPLDRGKDNAADGLSRIARRYRADRQLDAHFGQ